MRHKTYVEHVQKHDTKACHIYYLPHKLQMKRLPCSTNFMKGFMYALQREHLKGPLSPKSTTYAKYGRAT